MSEIDGASLSHSPESTAENPPSLKTIIALEKNISRYKERHGKATVKNGSTTSHISLFPATEENNQTRTIILTEGSIIERDDLSEYSIDPGIVIQRTGNTAEIFRVQWETNHLRDTLFSHITYPSRDGYVKVDGPSVTDKELQVYVTELKRRNKLDNRAERRLRNAKRLGTLKRGLGHTARVATAAAVLTVGARMGALPLFSDSTTPHEQRVEQSIAQEKIYPEGSLEAQVKVLEKNAQVDRKAENINIDNLRLDEEEDYTMLLETRQNGESGLVKPYASEELLEITYDEKTDSYSSTDGSEKYFRPNEAYHLLKPIVTNEALRSAMKSGIADRVVIRMLPHDYEAIDGAYVTGTVDVDQKKSKRNTVYVFVPSNVNNKAYNTVLTHETGHGFTGQNGISKESLESAAINTEELAQWRKLCGSLRGIAMDQVQAHTGELAADMKKHSHLIPEDARAAYQQVYEALERGEYEKFQPTGESNYAKKQTKVPESIAISPWFAFYDALDAQGIDSALPDSDDMVGLYTRIDATWNQLLSEHTIYSVLSEGSYGANGSEQNGGQPYSNWDELQTSIYTNIQENPKAFAASISQLPAEQKTVVLQLIDLSVKTLDRHVPETKDHDAFHIVLRTKYSLFQQNVS